jgi:glycerol-3-phosphate acyltransferase PlsY
MGRGLGHIEPLGRYFKGRAVATRLRAFLASRPWYLWLGMASLAVLVIISKVIEWLPPIASWPWYVQIIVLSLYVLAFVLLSGAMMIYVGIRITRFLMWGDLPEIKHERTRPKRSLPIAS